MSQLERVKVWLLKWDEYGHPNLEEAFVVKSGPDYYQPIEATQMRMGRFIPVEIGKNIFLDKRAAFEALLKTLQGAINGHHLAITALSIEAAEAKHELEVMEENGKQES